MPRPRVFRAGAAVYPSKIHVKPLSKIVGHLHSRTVPVLRQKPQRFKFIVEAVKLPAENFFVVLLFLFQHGDFVDLSLYDAAGWIYKLLSDPELAQKLRCSKQRIGISDVREADRRMGEFAGGWTVLSSSPPLFRHFAVWVKPDFTGFHEVHSRKWYIRL